MGAVMNVEMESLRPLGVVEIDDDAYDIFEVAIEHYHVIRRSDGCRIGSFRGSPTSMWLLEVESDDVMLDLLRSVVRSAIVDGVIVDMPTD
jgi:hypothetical protein